MMAGGISVNQKVFQELKKAYSEKFGSSPTALIHRLNHRFQDELDESGADLIADRTIRNFFNSPVPPNMQEKNLNYLCIILLGYDSYQDALRRLLQAELHLHGDWLDPYWKRLEQKCSTIRVLDMQRPISLGDLYVKVKFLQSIPGRRRKRLEDILENYGASINKRARRFGVIDEQSEDGLEAVKRHSRLMILGAPGAGKTTFLKSLAMYLTSEEQVQKTIPVFLRLKEFAESKDQPSLVEAVTQEFTSCLPNSSQLTRFVETAMRDGLFLLLLDALDEVAVTDLSRVCKEIETFTQDYPNNRLVITSRVGACDFVFQNIFEVQIADFELDQIEQLVINWFTACQEPEVSELFLKELNANQSILELAKNPLLLTMLCQTFDEMFSFPKNRHELYDEMVLVLLRTWDASRNIYRDQTVEPEKQLRLSMKRIGQLFGEIAYHGFECNPPKFIWKRDELEREIGAFMENLRGVWPTPADALSTIEMRYGLLVEQAKNIFTFSHLTFQEYFTAEHIVENPVLIPQVVQKHLLNRQWRETFIVIAEKLPKADGFLKLMFYYTNTIVESPALQRMLTWLDLVTRKADIGTSGWRAFYLALDLDADLYISNDIQVDRTIAHEFATALRDLNVERGKKTAKTNKARLVLSLAAVHGLVDPSASSSKQKLDQESESEFIQEMQKITEMKDIQQQLSYLTNLADSLGQAQLARDLETLNKSYPDPNDSCETQQRWADRLQDSMRLYLEVGYSVEFCDIDVKALEDYIYANALLVECICRQEYRFKDLLEEIVDYLLLPLECIPEHLRQVPEL